MSLTRERVAEKIAEIDDLLKTELIWTHGVGARDKDGTPVDPIGPEACCWCLLGAAWMLTGNQDDYRQVVMCLKQTINTPQITVGEYNDSTTFSDLKDMLGRAKTLAASSEPWTPFVVPDRLW